MTPVEYISNIFMDIIVYMSEEKMNYYLSKIEEAKKMEMSNESTDKR